MRKKALFPDAGGPRRGVVSRRGFFCGAIAAAGAPVAPREDARLIVSAPVLQNAAERSMGVAFAVSAAASGWVEMHTLMEIDIQRHKNVI